MAQTTFTESAAAYGLNIASNKDGGHAWADYDLDGDYDLVINTNGRGYLLRNDGGSFTDVTNINGNLAPDFLNGSLERTALFVDFNNDGSPDIFRNDHNNVKIYLQDPATNKFGNGIGGTVPNQHFTTLTDGLNSEGAGALDYDGDGDLDLFIDNHNFGIDILQNDGTGNFTHITRKIDSPNPPYNIADPTTWPLGLVQDATDGDYGSATDFNNDGWVDIVVRKRNQVDMFTNNAGIFGNEIEIDDANNSNKGAVGFYDFDNDGDFDLYWTENGTNQIHQNNGDGTWTGLGAATGIPISFSGQIEGLAAGDVDNDGDIDIFLAGNNTSKLYLNQINNGGGAMSFLDSGLTFNNTNGEGATFIDIDTDGDLDLYTNRTGSNRLFINNLGAAAQANHLYIDIIEDRDIFGLINTEKRFGIGATATILDCSGNVISGIREVNGGYGHGTQEPGVLHFGLPGGPNTAIVLEISYPRTSSGRVVVREELIPANFNNGSINIITVLPTSGNQAPIANDDVISTTENIAVTFDPLIDNDNGADSDPDGDSFSVISITQPANGTAVLNGDGTITYTPDAGFFGSDPFTYTIEDNTSCTLVDIQSVGNIIMTVNGDNDDDGIADIADFDDDNDGILDTDEGCGNVIVNGSFEQQDFSNVTTFPGGFTDVWGTYIGSSFNSNVLTGWNYTTNLDGWVGNQSPNWSANTFAPAYHGVQYLDLIGNNVHSGGTNNILTQVVNTTPGLTYSLSFYWGEYANHIAGVVQNLDVDVIDSSSNTIINETLTKTSVGVQSGFMGPNNWIYSERTFIATTALTTIQFTTSLSPTGASGPSLDFVNVSLASTVDCADTDNDGVPNAFDLDSDNDGILDAEEAGHGIAHTNGVIVGSVGTDGIPDAVQTSPNDENTNYTIAESTDDSDTIPNYLDLDADGDGIPDNVEAQTTTGYNPPSGTVDANGVFTNYTSGLNPTNTDGTDNADYLDTDSDNEGGDDTTEAGITLSGNDIDNDGLDDATDANTSSYADPGGTIDDPLAGAIILPDGDGDAATTGDIDFRDALDSSCIKIFASSATTGRNILYELNGTAMTPVFTAPQNIGGLAVSANGNAYYDNATFATPPLFSFNGSSQTNTGATVPGLLVGEAADAAGNVYYIDNAYHLRRVNFGVAGAASDLGALIFDVGDAIGPTLQFGDMAFDGNGRLLMYSSVAGTGLSYLYVISTSTLTAKNLGNVGPNGAVGVAFDASGNLITTANGGTTVVSVDFSSPSLTGTTIGAVVPTIYDLGSCAAPLFNPDLAAVKSVVNITQSQNPATLARAGDVLEYTIVVTNSGNFTTNNATFVDVIPTATTYVASSTTLNGSAVTDVSGNMPYATAAEINSVSQPSGVIIGGGGTATIVFRVIVDNITLPAFISNTATVTYPTVNGGITTTQTVDSNTTDTPTLNQADLSLTKTVSDAQPDQGDTITFTLRIDNAGPSSATGISVEDVLPADVTFLNATPATGTATFNAGTRVLTWNLGAFVLGAGNNITLTYTVTVDVCGEFVNQAEIISSSLTDPDSTPNFGG